jgi:hypothetical protein
MMWRTALKYGAMAGVFLVLLFWVGIRLGKNPVFDSGQLFIDLLILGLFIFFSCKDFKTYSNNGYLHFWQGMTLGFFTYVPAAVIFGVVVLVYFQIAPEAFETMRQQAVDSFMAMKDYWVENWGEEEFQQKVDGLNAKSAGSRTLELVFLKLITGFFVTPVVSVILRKKPE